MENKEIMSVVADERDVVITEEIENTLNDTCKNEENNTELDFKIKSSVEDTLYAVDFIIKSMEFYKPYALEFKTIIDNIDSFDISKYDDGFSYQEILKNIEFKKGMCEENYNSLLETMYKCKNSILAKDLNSFTREVEKSKNLVGILRRFYDLSFVFPEITCYYQFTNNIFQCAINNIIGCFVYFYDYYETAFKEEKKYIEDIFNVNSNNKNDVFNT